MHTIFIHETNVQKVLDSQSFKTLTWFCSKNKVLVTLEYFISFVIRPVWYGFKRLWLRRLLAIVCGGAGAAEAKKSGFARLAAPSSFWKILATVYEEARAGAIRSSSKQSLIFCKVSDGPSTPTNLVMILWAIIACICSTVWSNWLVWIMNYDQNAWPFVGMLS